MQITPFALLICVIGLLIFKLASEKWTEVGKIMFWTGLLVTLMSTMSKTYRLF